MIQTTNDKRTMQALVAFVTTAWLLHCTAAVAATATTAKTTSTPKSAAYWQSKLVSNPGDGSAERCLGLALFHEQRLPEAMPILQRAIGNLGSVRASSADAILFEHVGAAYSMAARRLAPTSTPAPAPAAAASVDAAGDSNTAYLSHHLPGTLSPQERAALQAAVAAFSSAAQVRHKHRGSRKGCEEQYAGSRALVLRAWGDALAWLGREEGAEVVWQLGVSSGLWTSPWCRPTTRRAMELPAAWPQFIFDAAAFEHLMPAVSKALAAAQRELASAANADEWSYESAGLHAGRQWQQLVLMVNGQMQDEACAQWLPDTCALLARIPALRLANGQVKLSRMQPGTHVRPHAGPTNARLRMHCGVHVPPEPFSGWLRVGTASTSWQDGQCFVFDESCEHEVHIPSEAPHPRTVLILDFANPLLDSVTDYLQALSHRGVTASLAGKTASAEKWVRREYANMHEALLSTHHAQ